MFGLIIRFVFDVCLKLVVTVGVLVLSMAVLEFTAAAKPSRKRDRRNIVVFDVKKQNDNPYLDEPTTICIADYNQREIIETVLNHAHQDVAPPQEADQAAAAAAAAAVGEGVASAAQYERVMNTPDKELDIELDKEPDKESDMSVIGSVVVPSTVRKTPRLSYYDLSKILTKIIDDADIVYFVTYVDPFQQYKHVVIRNLVGVLDAPDIKIIDLRQLFYLINPKVPTMDYDRIREYYGITKNQNRYVEYIELLDRMTHDFDVGGSDISDIPSLAIDHFDPMTMTRMTNNNTTCFYKDVMDEIYDKLTS